MAATLKKGTPVECRFGESNVYHGGVIRNRYRKQSDQYVVDFQDGLTLVMLLAESGEHVVWRRVVRPTEQENVKENVQENVQEDVQESVTEEIVVRYDLFKTVYRAGRHIPCGQEIIYLKGKCEHLPNGDYQMSYGPTKYFPQHTRDRISRRQYEECKRRMKRNVVNGKALEDVVEPELHRSEVKQLRVQRQLECLISDVGVKRSREEDHLDEGGMHRCGVCLEKKQSARGRCRDAVCAANEGTFLCDECYGRQKRARLGHCSWCRRGL